MVRETRHLWVGNLPDNIREEDIVEHFKRYGRVQSVKLVSRGVDGVGGGGGCATVSFMDIKSASKAHSVDQKLEECALTTEYHEPAAIPRDRDSAPPLGLAPPPLQHPAAAPPLSPLQYASPRFSHGSSEEVAFDRSSHFYGEGEAYARRSSTTYHPPSSSSSESLRGRPRDRLYRNGPYPVIESVVARVPGTTTGSHHRGTWNYEGTGRYTPPDHPSLISPRRDNTTTVVSITNHRSKKRSKSRSGSHGSESGGGSHSISSSRSRSHSSSSRSSSASSPRSSPSSSKTCSTHRSRSTLQSAVSTSSPGLHSEDRRALAICVRNVPVRSSDTSLKDGLYHEYKKHGKVAWVKILGQGVDRYGLVCFKKPEDAEKALQGSHEKLFFGTKIEVAPYHDVDFDFEFRPYEAELDEYHPKATRTLFIGNLEKDITASELQKHFDQFGQIIFVDMKKQSSSSAYAFVQYTDISSVVRAMRAMDGEHVGNNRVNLGYGKSLATTCVWVDGIADNVSDKYLSSQFSQFGPVTHVEIDRSRCQALVFYQQVVCAQLAVNGMRGIVMRSRKLQVDFASRECQDAFYESQKSSGLFENSMGASPASSTGGGSLPLGGARGGLDTPSSSSSTSSSGRTYRHSSCRPSPLPLASSYSPPASTLPVTKPRSGHHHHYRSSCDYPNEFLDRRPPYRSFEDTVIEEKMVVVIQQAPSEMRHQKERMSLDEMSSVEETQEHRRKCKHRRSHSGENSRPGTPLCDERPDYPNNKHETSFPIFTNSLMSLKPPPSPPPSPSPPPRPLSSSSEDSEPSTPQLTDWELRLKCLDEKYEKWSGCRTVTANTKITEPGEQKVRHKLLDLNVHELQPSDIVKSVLAKRSIFDEDSKRLENMNDKYEPKEYIPSRIGLQNFRSYLNPPPPVVPTQPPPVINKGLQYPFPSHPYVVNNSQISPQPQPQLPNNRRDVVTVNHAVVETSKPVVPIPNNIRRNSINCTLLGDTARRRSREETVHTSQQLLETKNANDIKINLESKPLAETSTNTTSDNKDVKAIPSPIEVIKTDINPSDVKEEISHLVENNCSTTSPVDIKPSAESLTQSKLVPVIKNELPRVTEVKIEVNSNHPTMVVRKRSTSVDEQKQKDNKELVETKTTLCADKSECNKKTLNHVNLQISPCVAGVLKNCDVTDDIEDTKSDIKEKDTERDRRKSKEISENHSSSNSIISSKSKASESSEKVDIKDVKEKKEIKHNCLDVHSKPKERRDPEKDKRKEKENVEVKYNSQKKEHDNPKYQVNDRRSSKEDNEEKDKKRNNDHVSSKHKTRESESEHSTSRYHSNIARRDKHKSSSSSRHKESEKKSHDYEENKRKDSHEENRRKDNHEESRRKDNHEDLRRKDSHDESKRKDSHEELKRKDNHDESKRKDSHEELKKKDNHDESKRKDSHEELKRKDNHDESKRKDSHEELKKKDNHDESKRRESHEEHKRKDSHDESRRKESYEDLKKKDSHDESRRKESYEELKRKDSHDESKRKDNSEELKRKDSHDESRRKDNNDESNRKDSHEESRRKDCHEENRRKDGLEEQKKKDSYDESKRKDNQEELKRKYSNEELKRKDSHDDSKRKDSHDESKRKDCHEELKRKDSHDESKRKEFLEEPKRKEINQDDHRKKELNDDRKKEELVVEETKRRDHDENKKKDLEEKRKESCDEKKKEFFDIKRITSEDSKRKDHEDKQNRETQDKESHSQFQRHNSHNKDKEDTKHDHNGHKKKDGSEDSSKMKKKESDHHYHDTSRRKEDDKKRENIDKERRKERYSFDSSETIVKKESDLAEKKKEFDMFKVERKKSYENSEKNKKEDYSSTDKKESTSLIENISDAEESSDRRSHIKKEQRKDKSSNNPWPAAVGCKRRLSSQDSMDSSLDDLKRIKTERRDSKDSKDSNKSTTSTSSSSSSQKKHNEKDKQQKNVAKMLEEKIKEDKEKDSHTKPKKEEKESDDNDSPKSRKEKKNSESKLGDTLKLSDCESSEKKRRNRILRENGLTCSESETGSCDDGNKKHSIFDIVDDTPAYISMYDKVKARSCKNMQKHEEEKKQEKLKEKFTQLKQSRAKREEKKRSTSYDEDTDSERGIERRNSKHMITSSEDDITSEYENKSKSKKTIMSDTSDDDILKNVKSKLKAKSRLLRSEESELDTTQDSLLLFVKTENRLEERNSSSTNIAKESVKQCISEDKDDKEDLVMNNKISVDTDSETHGKKKSHRKKEKRPKSLDSSLSCSDVNKKEKHKKERRKSHNHDSDASGKHVKSRKKKNSHSSGSGKKEVKLETSLFEPLSDESGTQIMKDNTKNNPSTWQVGQVFSDSDSDNEMVRIQEKKRRERKSRELDEAGKALEAKLLDATDHFDATSVLVEKVKKKKKKKKKHHNHHKQRNIEHEEGDGDDEDEEVRSTENELTPPITSQCLSSLLESPPLSVAASKKPDIAGFGLPMDENVHDSAVKSISECENLPAEKKMSELEPTSVEEKPTIIISQEETEDAVAALLEDAFGGDFDDYTPEENKPGSPDNVSEPDLQIDTDTEDTFDTMDFSKPPRTPDYPSHFDNNSIKDKKLSENILPKTPDNKIVELPKKTNSELKTKNETGSEQAIVKQEMKLPPLQPFDTFKPEEKSVATMESRVYGPLENKTSKTTSTVLFTEQSLMKHNKTTELLSHPSWTDKPMTKPITSLEQSIHKTVNLMDQYINKPPKPTADAINKSKHQESVLFKPIGNMIHSFDRVTSTEQIFATKPVVLSEQYKNIQNPDLVKNCIVSSELIHHKAIQSVCKPPISDVKSVITINKSITLAPPSQPDTHRTHIHVNVNNPTCVETSVVQSHHSPVITTEAANKSKENATSKENTFSHLIQAIDKTILKEPKPEKQPPSVINSFHPKPEDQAACPITIKEEDLIAKQKLEKLYSNIQPDKYQFGNKTLTITDHNYVVNSFESVAENSQPETPHKEPVVEKFEEPKQEPKPEPKIVKFVEELEQKLNLEKSQQNLRKALVEESRKHHMDMLDEEMKLKKEDPVVPIIAPLTPKMEEKSAMFVSPGESSCEPKDLESAQTRKELTDDIKDKSDDDSSGRRGRRRKNNTNVPLSSMSGVLTRRARFSNPAAAAPFPEVKVKVSPPPPPPCEETVGLKSSGDVYEFKDESDEDETDRPRPLLSSIKSPHHDSKLSPQDSKLTLDVKNSHESKIMSETKSLVVDTKCPLEINTQEDSSVITTLDNNSPQESKVTPELKSPHDVKIPQDSAKIANDLKSPPDDKMSPQETKVSQQDVKSPLEVKSLPQDLPKSAQDVIKSPLEVKTPVDVKSPQDTVAVATSLAVPSPQSSEARSPSPSSLNMGSASTRKSRRLQEKDVTRNTVDDTIDEVIRTARATGRRNTRSLLSAGAPGSSLLTGSAPGTCAEVITRKSPRRKPAGSGATSVTLPALSHSTTPPVSSVSLSVSTPTRPIDTSPVSSRSGIKEINEFTMPVHSTNNLSEAGTCTSPMPTPEDNTPLLKTPAADTPTPNTSTSVEDTSMLIDPVSGELIPVREAEEGQYIPVQADGTRAPEDSEEPAEKRQKVKDPLIPNEPTPLPKQPIPVPLSVATPTILTLPPKLALTKVSLANHFNKPLNVNVATTMSPSSLPHNLSTVLAPGLAVIPHSSVAKFTTIAVPLHAPQAAGTRFAQPQPSLTKFTTVSLPFQPQPGLAKFTSTLPQHSLAKLTSVSSSNLASITTMSMSVQPQATINKFTTVASPVITQASIVKLPPDTTPQLVPMNPKAILLNRTKTQTPLTPKAHILQSIANGPTPLEPLVPLKPGGTPSPGLLSTPRHMPMDIDPPRPLPYESPSLHTPTPHFVHPSLYHHYLREAALAQQGGYHISGAAAGQAQSVKCKEAAVEARVQSPHPQEARSTDSPAVATLYAHGHGAAHLLFYETPPPDPAPPPHLLGTDTLYSVLERRYPVMWQGELVLKCDQAFVQMHYVFGNHHLAREALPLSVEGGGASPTLRIAQRMRLEQTQIDGVVRKMQTDGEHCMLLALPCGRTEVDVVQQSAHLQSGFITYLQQKQAAGIVNIAAPGSAQAAYIVHVFPSCEFANNSLASIDAQLLKKVSELTYLVIIIATTATSATM